MGRRAPAHLFDRLMIETRGLDRYSAQGGDGGSSISGWMGYEGNGSAAVHMNMLGWQSPGVTPQTEEEKEHAARAVVRRGFPRIRGHARTRA